MWHDLLMPYVIRDFLKDWQKVYKIGMDTMKIVAWLNCNYLKNRYIIGKSCIVGERDYFSLLNNS